MKKLLLLLLILLVAISSVSAYAYEYRNPVYGEPPWGKPECEHLFRLIQPDSVYLAQNEDDPYPHMMCIYCGMAASTIELLTDEDFVGMFHREGEDHWENCTHVPLFCVMYDEILEEGYVVFNEQMHEYRTVYAAVCWFCGLSAKVFTSTGLEAHNLAPYMVASPKGSIVERERYSGEHLFDEFKHRYDLKCECGMTGEVTVSCYDYASQNGYKRCLAPFPLLQ